MAGNIGYGEVSDPNNPLSKAIDKALKEQYSDGLFAPADNAPVELVPSGIRPLPAEEQIKKYLDEITPKDKPTTFRFESAMFWIAVGSVGSGLGIIALTLLIGGWL